MTYPQKRYGTLWACSLLLTFGPVAVHAETAGAPFEMAENQPSGTALPSINVDKPATPVRRPPRPATARPRLARTVAPPVRRLERPVRAAAAPIASQTTAGASAPAATGPGTSATGIGAGPPPVSQRFQLPQTSASITARGIEDTVNVVDTEDAIKYFPSLFVRKRNNGDTQPVLATRTNGVNGSARTLVYADDVNISALIANNNTIGAPRWGLVAPEEIDRIDFLYGPFAAAYPGNSVGGVLLIQTKMPQRLEVNIKQNEGFQTFNQYSTNKTFRTDQTSASIGDRVESLLWFISGSHLNSFSQPLAYVTNGSVPAGTTGAYFARNKTGAIADVVGAGGLQHQQIENVKLKVAYDFTSWLQATYTFGFYSNFTSSNVQSYLTNATGATTFGGVSGFASNQYTLDEKHMANSIKVATTTRGPFDFEAVVSNYDFLNDVQRSPFGVTTGTNFTTNGKSAVLNGTNWTNADLKGIWRPFGINGAHEVSFGLHGDQYNLHSPTYATPLYYGGSDVGGPLYSNGRGITETGALWAQDAWRLRSDLKFTVGARVESWRASDGLNLATTSTAAGAITTTTTTIQPSEKALRVSPKATLAWDPESAWSVKASFGEANRFPTVSELYQIVTVGTTNQTPNPNLRPEQAFSEELAIERRWTDGSARISLFQENDNSALISQTSFLIGATPVTFFTNVDATRIRGVELAARQDNVVIRGMELSGSVTYADSRILSDPSFASTTGTTATGKRVPYIPDWRATLAATYRPDAHWAFTVAGRYSGKQYSTLDNSDLVSGVFGAFDRFFVVDTRINYAFDDRASIGFGVDNIGNEKYFLYHPFPQRTFYADARMKF